MGLSIRRTNNMKNPQKGFIVPLLMVIIAVLVIGSGVYVYKNKKTETSTVVNTETQQSGQNQQQTNTQTPPVSATKQLTLTQAPPLFETPILTISPSTTAGWKTYTNDKYKFEFKYPHSFVITDYSFEMSNGSLGLVFTDKDVNFVVRNIELSEINFTDYVALQRHFYFKCCSYSLYTSFENKIDCLKNKHFHALL